MIQAFQGEMKILKGLTGAVKGKIFHVKNSDRNSNDKINAHYWQQAFGGRRDVLPQAGQRP
jgi:hypothetical protein